MVEIACPPNPPCTHRVRDVLCLELDLRVDGTDGVKNQILVTILIVKITDKLRKPASVGVRFWYQRSDVTPIR